jgi:hypothetical protein
LDLPGTVPLLQPPKSPIFFCIRSMSIMHITAGPVILTLARIGSPGPSFPYSFQMIPTS